MSSDVVVRRYIDFLKLLISTPLVSALFAAASYILLIFECFLFLFQYMFVIYLILFFRSINKHKGDYGRPTDGV